MADIMATVTVARLFHFTLGAWEVKSFIAIVVLAATTRRNKVACMMNSILNITVKNVSMFGSVWMY